MRTRGFSAAVKGAVVIFSPLMSMSAHAQQCMATGTDQTCTNSIFLSGGATGLSDAGSPTITNTATGAISGNDPAQAAATGISAANTVTLNNAGIVQATGPSSVATGIASTTADVDVTNSGMISVSGSSTQSFGIAANAGNANLINSGAFYVTSAGAAFGLQSTNPTNAVMLNNSGTFSVISTAGQAIGVSAGNATNVSNSGTIAVSGPSKPFGIQSANALTFANSGMFSVMGTAPTGTVPQIAAGIVLTNATASTVFITNTGTMSVTGAFQTFGIDTNNATGAVTFNNSGTLSVLSTPQAGVATPATALGILASTATVNNSGTITIGGASQSAGIQATGAATVNNSGTLTVVSVPQANATLTGAVGIQAGSVTLANSGTISATGSPSSSFAIETTGAAVITNSGTIAADTAAIQAGSATINNSGFIVGSAGTPNGFGINAGTVNITNTGRIIGGTAIGLNGGGIGSTLTSSGAIFTTGNTAIDFSQSSFDTLTFLPGSRIIGNILLGGNDTINIHSGHDIAWLLTFGGTNANGAGGGTVTSTALISGVTLGGGGKKGGHGGDATVMPTGLNAATSANFIPAASGLVLTGTTVNVTGGAPFAISNDQVATLDPTALAFADRTLLDFTGGMSSLVQARFNSMTAPGATPLSGAMLTSYAPTTNDAFPAWPVRKAPAASPFDTPVVVWANAFGGARSQDADAPDLHAIHGFGGGALGIDTQVQPNLNLGVFFGGGFGRLDVDLDSQRVDTDYVTGGVYGRYSFDSRFVDFTVFGGSTHSATMRQIADNLSVTGLDTATASYNGYFINPELGLGWRIADRNGVTWIPEARVRYLAGHFDGYSETGSPQNLTVNGRTVQDLEGRLGMTLAANQPVGAGLFGLQVTGGIIGLSRLGSTTIDTNLIGQGVSFAAPGRDSAVGLFTGFGFDYRFRQNVKAFLNLEGTAMSDSSLVGTARGGVAIKF